VLNRRIDYVHWRLSEKRFADQLYIEAAERYDSLYRRLYCEKAFLHNYAEVLSWAARAKESNAIIDRLLRTACHSEILMLRGSNCAVLGDYAGAEQAYIRASQLVPKLYRPLYELMRLYLRAGQPEKARATAQSLLEKPVKIPSKQIDDMRREAQKIVLESHRFR
jgi:tetratricopeptide (TPR) repeat protein